MRNLKLVLLLGLLLVLPKTTDAQLKVDNSGLVGIGTTTTNPWFNLYLGNPSKGGMLHYSAGRYFRSGQSNSRSAVVGSSSDRIDFWYSTTGHNIVYAQKYERSSDSTLKTNIVPLRGGLETILQLKTYSYEVNEGDLESGTSVKEYGFLSQEVSEILPEITDSSRGILAMDYDQITPFLTDATQELYYQTKELETIVDSLVRKVTDLENELYGGDLILTESVLYQNEPNPFKENTVIKYELPSVYSSASIMLFNMNGAYVEQFDISGVGEGELTIEGETLEAGMYLYSLVVDDKEIDTKRLILQQ